MLCGAQPKSRCVFRGKVMPPGYWVELGDLDVS
jgi:hypothetical protein